MAEILREKGSIFCVTHPKTKLVVLCNKCNILMCHKCMLDKHFGHLGTDIEDIAETKYRNIDDFIIKTEGTTIPDLKQNFQQTEANVIESLKVLQSGVAEAYECEKSLIELVKKNTKYIVTKLKSEIQNINQQFSQFKIDSDNLLAKLEAAVNECKQTKRSDNDILMIDVADGVQELGETKLTYPKTQKLIFIAGTNSQDLIQKAFGYITQEETTGKRNLPNQVLTSSKPHVSSNDNPGGAGVNQAARPKTNKYLESKPTVGKATKLIGTEDQVTKTRAEKDQAIQSVKSKQLLSKPVVIHSVDLNFVPHSIEIFKDGTTCICGKGESKLKLMIPNRKYNSLDLDNPIFDIAIHPVTEELYAVFNYNIRDDSKGIRKIDIHTGTSTVVFVTEYLPSCMAFGKDNSLLVGFTYKGQVTVYTIKGDIENTISVGLPTHITVSSVTGDVAVAGDIFGTSVFDKLLQLKYQYKGSEQHKPDLGKQFCSIDSVYDTDGHLLIGDYNNKEVHICDASTGKLLKTISLIKFGQIRSLSLTSDGTIVVGTGNPNKLVDVLYI